MNLVLVLPEEIAVLQRISRDSMAGMGTRAQCRALNEKGQVSATGGTCPPVYCVCERGRAGGGCRSGYIGQDEVDAAVVARVRAR